jgi:UDP-glucose 4-epimerase
MTTERVLVTGGAGFIGSHIVDALIAAGCSVSVVDNLHTGKRANVHAQARFHEVDIRDAGALNGVFAVEQPAIVFHEAARADVRGSLDDPAGYAAVNVVGTLNVLEACRLHGTRKIIFASTGGAIYGDPLDLPASESCPARPLDPYGASKLAAETYLSVYRHNFGLDFCALRYGNVYGPRQDPYGEAGVVAIFIGQMFRGQPVTIYGDGCQQRDFIYVADIARANVLAMSRGSGAYNLGTGIPADINAIYGELARLTGYNGKGGQGMHAVHAPAKKGEVRTTFLNANRARRELGWNPQVSLSEGLARTVASLRERVTA